MWPFHKKTFVPSDEAQSARNRAIEQRDYANAQLTESKSLSQRLKTIREKNHFSEALTAVYKGDR